MSLFNALSTAVSSVGALNSAVRVVSDNVANSTNENYNRRISRFENLQFGGVEIADISRAANEGLQRDLFQQTTIAAGDEIRDKLYIQMEQLIGTINGQTPLVDEVERLRSAFKALEATPESDAAENDVVIAAQGLEKELTRLSDGLDLIENQVLADIPNLVETINETTAEIDRLNAAIAVERSNGRPTSSLENLRDAQIEELSKFTQIRTFNRDDGSVGVYTTTGLVLVDSNPETFSWDAATRTLTLTGSTATNLVTSGQLPDGQLAALTNFIRTDSTALASATIGDAPLEKFRNQLDELAFSFADDSTGRTSGTVFVKDNTDLTGSNVITAGNDLTFTIGTTLLGTVTVGAGNSIDTVVDAINAIPQMRARVDGFGNLQVLSSGGAVTIAGSARTEFGLGTTITADATDTLSYAYKAERTQGTVALTTGTDLTTLAGIANGDQISFNNTALGGAVTFTINTGDSVQTLLDAVNAQEGMYARLGEGNVLEFTSAGGSLTVNNALNTPLTALGFTVNGTAASIDGTASATESNDLFVAESGTTPTSVTRTNFALATAIENNTLSVKAGNLNQTVEGLNGSNRGFSGSGVNIENTDYTGLATKVLSELTQTGERATRNAEESETLRAGLFQSLRDETGVDVDEEMATLTVLQNSYAATARVIDAINQMFQALELAGR